MRSLFDDTKNPLFRELCKIVGEIHSGAKFTRRDILKRIFSLPEFIYLEAPEKLREEEIVDALFKFTSSGFAQIPAGKNFSLPPSDTEIFWLRAVLTDEELFFLLPDELCKKLLSRVEKFPPLYEKNSWRKLRVNETSAGKILSGKLSMIVEALRLGRKIFSGAELLTPCRLEYDLSADKYFLLVWREELQAAEKISVEVLGKLTLSDEFISPECDALLKKFYAENVAEVSFKVANTRNAVERCFALFSSFDKKARLLDDGNYFLTVRYCPLDEEEILDKIFLLGATVTIIEPAKFRERVIKKFAEIKTLYT